MRVSHCSNPACGRPFQVNQFTTKFSIDGEPGKIMCPHCGQVTEADSNSLFLTHALSPEEEAQFSSTDFAPDKRAPVRAPKRRLRKVR
jgi:hypothetical protein